MPWRFKMKKIKSNKLTRGILLDVAVTMAVKYKYGYKGYEEEFKAIRALKRKCPKFSHTQCINAWQMSKKLYGLAEKVARELRYPNEEMYTALLFKDRKGKGEWLIIDKKRTERIKMVEKRLLSQFKTVCSAFLRSSLFVAANQAYYWSVER